jgi:antirestriction protein ArdC
MAKVSYTAEQRKARLDAAHAELTIAVEAISTSDEWRAFLDFSRQLPSYSGRNRMWLFQQAYEREWVDDEGSPILGAVAGYRTWLKLGRQVRKGEHGLKVLAPAKYKVRDEETGEESWRLRGFTVDTVFAERQTDGDELPERISPTLLEGAGPDGAWYALEQLATARGFEAKRAALFPENGTTSFASHVVIVADRLDEAAAVKTLAHELGHVLMHDMPLCDYHANRGRCEVEAESVAYLVCRELGLETDAYSFAYVATWAGGETKVVADAADKVLKCAREILEAHELASQLVAA